MEAIKDPIQVGWVIREISRTKVEWLMKVTPEYNISNKRCTKI